jgi:hypothetical protein
LKVCSGKNLNLKLCSGKKIIFPKSLDILNVIYLISTTKKLIQSLRNNDWELLFENVKSFCEKHEIKLSDLNRRYVYFEKSLNYFSIDKNII